MYMVLSKRNYSALVFPPVNNYRRFIIHQLVQDRFPDLLHTFSIGQGSARRTVVCYKSDVRRDWEPKPNAPECKTSLGTKRKDRTREMEDRQSPSMSPECKQLQRQAKSAPTIEIYRPPAARRANNCSQINGTQTQSPSNSADTSSVKNVRQRRPDRAVYVPRHRRSLEERISRNSKDSPADQTTLNEDPNTNNNSRLQNTCCVRQGISGDPNLDNRIFSSGDMEIANSHFPRKIVENAVVTLDSKIPDTHGDTKYNTHKLLEEEVKEDAQVLSEEKEIIVADNLNENSANFNVSKSTDKVESINDEPIKMTQATVKEEDRSLLQHLDCNNIVDDKNRQLVEQNVISDVLIISDNMRKKSERSEQASPILVIPPEKKVKKIERQKSKPVPPPSPPIKISRDECDWDSLFDDNGDCLDPTLIEELSSAVGEVTIEQPKNDYKAYTKQVEVSSDEFAHVVEIYNFPSEFKTCDLAAAFSSFKNGGFELKWVDDTHCLGVFSSPLVAAEVLASNHPFVKTRPLSEATALSKTKARRTAEFLQPYRNRPETCAALAKRLVTGALGVKLATARQEREHEKNVLREAKEKRRLANKQREDVWEGIIPAK
ncbi:coiled-coil domain-containing protein R3HCC1L isoform X2 [Nylanderia fulva]|uniref:coiled-coil domain-containing protein R3HCC1L isoform X2 n=1 Tax=Nylanderia fulva TaxID=613905 RepID=UPI0010FB0569|nr:coiled-coil domain-containing protein R3HCC1L isoform X2 [Nylanderia fulva]